MMNLTILIKLSPLMPWCAAFLLTFARTENPANPRQCPSASVSLFTLPTKMGCANAKLWLMFSLFTPPKFSMETKSAPLKKEKHLPTTGLRVLSYTQGVYDVCVKNSADQLATGGLYGIYHLQRKKSPWLSWHSFSRVLKKRSLRSRKAIQFLTSNRQDDKTAAIPMN